jgi:hypothetical protein
LLEPYQETSTMLAGRTAVAASLDLSPHSGREIKRERSGLHLISKLVGLPRRDDSSQLAAVLDPQFEGLDRLDREELDED